MLRITGLAECPGAHRNGRSTVRTVSQLRVDGVSLYYEEHGSGSPMLCIHGTGGSGLVWGDAVAQLAGHGRVIVYDRRGCTRSERPETYDATTVGEQADDAAALLQALRAAPAVIIGRSYGGAITVDLTQRYPELVQALVLLEPAILGLSAETRAWAEALQAEVLSTAAAAGPAAGADRFYRIVLGDVSWEAMPDTLRQMYVDNGPAILAELNGEPFMPNRDALAHLTQPVLIVSGESSPPAFRAIDDMLTHMIPGARHEVIGGGHLVSPAAPPVLAFLQPILARSQSLGPRLA